MGRSKPVQGLYDQEMWAGFEKGWIEIQCCTSCKQLRYPPAAACPDCLSFEWAWHNVSGMSATILSWVIFHRQYLDDFPPPYNVIAVQLDNGPILVTNLYGSSPEGNWIGRRVTLEVVERAGRRQHGARLQIEL